MTAGNDQTRRAPRYPIALSPRCKWDKFSLEERRAFIAFVRDGDSFSTAQKKLRLSPSMVSGWLRRGREAAGQWEIEEDPAKMRALIEARAFYLDVQKAKRESVDDLETRLDEAATDPKNWRALVAMLRVRDPERWGGRNLEAERQKRVAEVIVAQAKAKTATAVATIFESKARIAVREANDTKGYVVLAPEFRARLLPDEAVFFDRVMSRLKLEYASEEQARAAVAERDVNSDDVADLERLEAILDSQELEANERKIRVTDGSVEGSPFDDAMEAIMPVTAKPSPEDEVRPPARLVIVGGPKTGKTTLALSMRESNPGIDVRHTDSLIGQMEWSEASAQVAEWFDAPGPWVVEGVATVRALRKWLLAHETSAPCDEVLVLSAPKVGRTSGQEAMAKGVATMWAEIVDDLIARGVRVTEGT